MLLASCAAKAVVQKTWSNRGCIGGGGAWRADSATEEPANPAP